MPARSKGKQAAERRALGTRQIRRVTILWAAILGLMRRMKLGVLGGILASLFAAGCSDADSSAQVYAKSACSAYQHIGRVQISTTEEQASALHDVARSDVRAAAAFDSRWTQLSSDLQSALDLQEQMQNPPDAKADQFFEIDKRVQDDCKDAGQDIGDLKP
jgi:hypothetical protein